MFWDSILDRWSVHWEYEFLEKRIILIKRLNMHKGKHKNIICIMIELLKTCQEDTSVSKNNKAVRRENKKAI